MTLERRLGATAVLLGALAVAFGPPVPPKSIAPLELARWLRAGKDHLRVIDIRSGEAFDVLHVTRAESVPLAAIADTAFASTDAIVLYSDAGASSEKAVAELRARGATDIYVLRRGMAGWLEDVMYPALAPRATPSEQEAEIAELSRFFGGSPRIAGPSTTSSAAEAAARTRRRGC
jgi:rhodanese-related sulfurtransferase